MSEKEEPIRVLRRVIDAVNSVDNTTGLRSMTEDVAIIDDVPPFRRLGRKEAELWFQRLALARDRVDASFRLKSANVRIQDDRAYIVASGLYTGTLEGVGTDVEGTLTATLIRRHRRWLIDALIWGCEL